MNKIIQIFGRVPGWLLILIVFAGLYLTGLHTEVIGQVQRIILATGLIKPEVEPLAENTSSAEERTAVNLNLADYNFSLRSLTGEEVSMESLRGKVVFLNFWATWCPPCIAEMPNIQSLYEKVKSNNIAFVMVSLDKEPTKAQKFIQKKAFTFPVYTPNGPVPPVYESTVIPTTLVISPAGEIMTRQEGMANYDNQEFRDLLQNLAQRDKSSSQNQVVSLQSVNSREAKALLQQQPNTLILDVRTLQEYAGGHLAAAMNLDFNGANFADKLARLDKNKTYLVYCAVGGRSSKASKLMQQMGFKKIINVNEGFPALEKQGIPVSR